MIFLLHVEWPEIPPHKRLLTYYVWRIVWRPCRPFLGHQTWSWTTLRRGNVFFITFTEGFFIFVTFLRFYFYLNVFLHLWLGICHWALKPPILRISSVSAQYFLHFLHFQKSIRFSNDIALFVPNPIAIMKCHCHFCGRLTGGVFRRYLYLCISSRQWRLQLLPCPILAANFDFFATSFAITEFLW